MINLCTVRTSCKEETGRTEKQRNLVYTTMSMLCLESYFIPQLALYICVYMTREIGEEI